MSEINWPLMAEAESEGTTGTAGESSPVEAEARNMGWAPKEEFRGDASRWVDAETFVKNGKERLPIISAENKRLKQELEDQRKAAKEFKQYHEETAKREYERARQELQADIERATETGDKAGAKKAAEDLAKVEADRAVAQNKPAEPDPVFESWRSENAWFNDASLQKEAQAEAYRLRVIGETVEGVDFLEKVKEGVKKRFPEKFSNPRRQQTSVEGSSGGGEGGQGKDKGWSDLPQRAKEAGERFIKAGYVKDKAAYAKDYWAQDRTEEAA